MRLRVMPDFTSSGIWGEDQDGKETCMVDFDELGISKELEQEFEKWIYFYDSCFDKDYSFFKPGKAKIVNETGFELAKKLKREFPNTEIWFWEENTISVNGKCKYVMNKHLIGGNEYPRHTRR